MELPLRNTPSVVKWARGLLGTCVVLLLTGGSTVELFFPELKGGGLDSSALLILASIWAIGIAGILLALIGWIRYPALYTSLEFEHRSDGRVFGWLTKGLGLIAMVLMWLGTAVLLMDSTDPNPMRTKGLLFYCVSCYGGLAIYLAVFYGNANHAATTTYLNLLTPFLAFALIPLSWPLLVVLNCVVSKSGCDALDRTEP